MSTDHEFAIAYTGNIVEAEFAKSLLDAAGIPCYLKDEAIGTLAPWIISPVGAVKVVVKASDLERAKPIIEDMQNDGADDAA
jgi:hypothetical protein